MVRGPILLASFARWDRSRPDAARHERRRAIPSSILGRPASEAPKDGRESLESVRLCRAESTESLIRRLREHSDAPSRDGP
jgi:hypothetical protein